MAYLVTAGSDCYPCSGDTDWKGVYPTLEEAQAAIILDWDEEEPLPYEVGMRGNYYEDFEGPKFKIKGETYDWYDIVDLEKWKLKC
jgi:hypothetical protein